MSSQIAGDDKFSGKVSHVFWRLALPLLVVFSIQAGFNLVDTFFVAGLGTAELAAINIVFPIFFILIAAGEGFSMATNNLVSKSLGEKNYDLKNGYILTSFLVSVVLGIILILFSYPIIYYGLGVFDISNEVFNYAKDYLFIIFFGSFLLFLFSNIFAIAVVYHDVKIQVILGFSSFLLNIFLDWFFIYILGYKLVGVAFTSVIVFLFIFIVGLFYILKKDYFSFKNGFSNTNINIIIDYLKYFLPAFLATGLIIGEFFVNNWFVSQFGEKAIAAYGIGIKVQDMIIMPIISFGIAFMTMVGYYIGKKDSYKLKETSKFVFKVKLSLIIIFAIVLSLFMGNIGYLFTSDEIIIKYLSFYGKIIAIFSFFFFLHIYSTLLLQVMGYGKTRVSISFLLVVLIIIFQYIGSKYGLYEVWLGWLAAQIIIGIVSYLIYRYILKNKLENIEKY